MGRNVLKNAAACLAFVVLCSAAAHAQQSAFQDARGESSVFIRDGGGFGRINATDKSIELGFLRDRGREEPWFGLDFKGKASGDFASLFNGGTPSPEAEVGFTVGKRFFSGRSDNEIMQKCIADTEKNLTPTDRENLVLQYKKDYIAGRRIELIERFREEAVKVDEEKITIETWREIFDAEKAKGSTDAVASGIATAATPKKVQAKVEELTKAADVEARADAQARLEAESPEIRAKALKNRKDELSNLCALEEPELEREVYDWVTFRVAYRRASYKLLDPDAAFADQVRKQGFDGFSTTLAYNRLITLDNLSEERKRRVERRLARQKEKPAPREERADVRSKGSLIIGASLGVARRNNADDLKPAELEDQSFTSSSETTQRRVVTKQTVLNGEYKEFIAVPLNTDVVWFPGRFNSRVAIDFFTRSNVGEGDRKFVPGVGLFLTKEKSPTKVVGGISFSYDDGKGKVGLVGGFHF